jgi:predicted nucleic-acid-binding Zn-ribbon protein
MSDPIKKTGVVRAWKCFNCEAKHGVAGGHDFEAADPVCQKCGADKRKNNDAIAPRAVMHFDPPTDIAWKGKNTIACNPAVAINRQGIRATGDHRAVSCERCKATEEFKRAAAAGEDLGGVVDVTDLE